MVVRACTQWTEREQVSLSKHHTPRLNPKERCLTAKDGRSQVLNTGNSGGQARYNAHNRIKKGGVRGHGQDGGLTAADLLALDHHSEAHAAVERPTQGSHHPPTHEPAITCWILDIKAVYFCKNVVLGATVWVGWRCLHLANGLNERV